MFFKKKKITVKSTPEKTAIKKINALSKKGNEESTVVELNKLIKEYLRVKYKISPTLTHEEVINKLEEKKIHKDLKIDLSHLLMQIYQKEYFPHEPIGKEEIDFLLSLSTKTLEELQSGKKGKEAKTPVVKEEPSQQKSKELVKLEKDLSVLGQQENIDWRDDNIRKIYTKIRNDFDTLSDAEKETMRPKIMALFKFQEN